jgi:signal transduction histidine kinase
MAFDRQLMAVIAERATYPINGCTWCSRPVLETGYEPVWVHPGRLQKAAKALQGPRTADSDECPHDGRHVPRRDHHQVPLRNARRPRSHVRLAPPVPQSRSTIASSPCSASSRYRAVENGRPGATHHAQERSERIGFWQRESSKGCRLVEVEPRGADVLQTTCNTRRLSGLGPALLLTAGWLIASSWNLAAQEAAELPLQRVLVIDVEGPTRPAFVQFMEGFREEIAKRQGTHFEVFTENLELSRMGRDANDDRTMTWLLEKYRGLSFDVIVSTSDATRRFVLRNRTRFSSHAAVVSIERVPPQSPGGNEPVSIVFCDVPEAARRTVRLAARLFPELREIALIAQTRSHPGAAKAVREQIQIEAENIGCSFLPLVDFPLAELRATVAALSNKTAVVFLNYTVDEDGNDYVPAELLESLCRESASPFFGMSETYLGRGVVAGVGFSTREVGQAAAKVVSSVTSEEVPAVHAVAPEILIDSRVLNRFSIPRDRLPATARVLFDAPQFWQEYWLQITAGVAVLVIQGVLLLTLVIQYRQRVRAEQTVSEQRDQIAHAGRVSMMGQLAAALAHELGQPLGSILNNVEAAAMLLQNDSSENAAELRDIISDIAADEKRADLVLARIRSMIKRQTFTVSLIDPVAVVRDAATLAQVRLKNAGISLTIDCPAAMPAIAGDSILLQQALLNLINNSADAIGAATDRRGTTGAIAIRLRQEDRSVAFSVSDNGGGIDEQVHSVEQVLQPFQTSRTDGIGMGLPIVTTIAEQHDGSLSLDNRPGDGLTVTLKVPLAV